MTVVTILVALELLMFWTYFTGEISPAPDDFIGSYNNEPLAWWRDLASQGLPDWVPYAWGGYPAAVSIQSGSWYLPLGLAAWVSPYSIHAAAVVQALHVAFGALGTYTLGRRWGLGHAPSTFGLVAYFFAVGFFTNGLHPDIVRGFAWAPWVLLVLSPMFPWRRRWGVPLAAVILWQALCATYPGIIVALVYTGAAAVVAFQITRRPPIRGYLLPMFTAGIGSLMLSAPKYFPALALRGVSSPTGQDDSVFSGQMLGTLFYPYDLPTMPNDLSMRSFFVVAPVWLLVVLAWRHRSGRVAVPAAVFLTAAALGLPFLPWYELLAGLPGMGVSRFRMADFRVPLVLGLVVLAMVILSAEMRRAATHRGRATRRATTVSLCLVPVAALMIGVLGDFGVERWATPWVLLVASSALVWWMTVKAPSAHGTAVGPVRRGSNLAATAGLIGLAAVSGVNWAYDVTPPWRFDRETIESSTWGADSDALIARYVEPTALTQRPARTPLDDAVAPPTDVFWNSSFYTGVDAVGGYVNLKGSAAFDSALRAVTRPETYFEARSFLAAPGTGIAVADADALPPVEDVAPCVLEGECGDAVSVRPVAYAVGHLQYDLEVKAATSVLFNEAYYPGWEVTACADAADSCVPLEVGRGGAGLVLVDVPSGHWTVTLDYSTPGKGRDLAVFGAGWILLAGAGAMFGRRESRSRTDFRSTRRADSLRE